MPSQNLTIYVAYCVKLTYYANKLTAEDLESYMSQAFVGVRLKQRWTTLPRSQLEDIGREEAAVAFVEVSDHDGPYHDLDGKVLPISGTQIHVDIFYLSDQSEELTKCFEWISGAAPDDLEEQPHTGQPKARVYDLPNTHFAWQWNSLICDDFFHYRMLRYLIRRVSTPASESAHSVQSSQPQTVLFHGPPGNGKTTLCEALAQQMSIRLRSRYLSSKLIKVNASSFFSRWFSESDKAVTRLFSCIETMLVADKHRLIFVLMDEIEGLARSRKSSAEKAEPSDMLRTTNALLLGLDALSRYPNVLLFFTTNLLDAVDDAFVDRMSRMEFVGPPGAPARYEIFRAAFAQMVQQGVVSLQPTTKEDGEEVVLLDDGPREPPTIDAILPPYRDLSSVSDKPGPAQTLNNYAKECEGLSGRKLAHLPSDGVCWGMDKDTCTLGEALEVMGKEVARLRKRSSS